MLNNSKGTKKNKFWKPWKCKDILEYFHKKKQWKKTQKIEKNSKFFNKTLIKD